MAINPESIQMQSLYISGLPTTSIGKNINNLQEIPGKVFSTGVYNADNLKGALEHTSIPFEEQLRRSLPKTSGAIIQSTPESFDKNTLKKTVNNKKADIIANLMKNAGMKISQENRDYFSSVLNTPNSTLNNREKIQILRRFCDHLPNVSSKDTKKIKDKIEEAVGHTDKEVDRFIKHSSTLFNFSEADFMEDRKIKDFCKNFARATNSPVYRCLSEENIPGIERLKTYDTEFTKLKTRWNQKCLITNIFVKIFKGFIGLPSFKSASATATEDFSPSEGTASYAQPAVNESGKSALTKLNMKEQNFSLLIQHYAMARNNGNEKMQRELLPHLILTEEFLSHVTLSEDIISTSFPDEIQNLTIKTLVADIEALGSETILSGVVLNINLASL